MIDSVFARVRYFAHQFLRRQDMADEQSYHVAMRRIHNIGPHTWGIASGLELETGREGNLVVQPGLAIDGYGRELIRSQPYSVNPREFDIQASDTLDAWLLYSQQNTDPAEAGYGQCPPDGAGPSHRVVETATVELHLPDPNLADADLSEQRQPADVPTEDLRFGPRRVPSDDPARRWPVFLGRVRRTLVDGQLKYDVNPGGRPYAGLVGEAVFAPSGKAWLQIGAEKEDDDVRFGVFLPRQTSGDLAQPASPRLSINDQGNLALRGDMELFGDLTVDGGAVEFGAGPAYNKKLPWRIYRTTEARTGQSGNNSQDVEELRVEMDDSGGKGLNEVVIGVWSSEANAFKPCLTIADNCSVRIDGDLTVKGNVHGKITSAEAAAAGGPGGQHNIVHRIVDTTSGGQPAATAFDQLAAGLADTPEDLEQFAAALRLRPELAEKLARLLQPGIAAPGGEAPADAHAESAPEPVQPGAPAGPAGEAQPAAGAGAADAGAQPACEANAAEPPPPPVAGEPQAPALPGEASHEQPQGEGENASPAPAPRRKPKRQTRRGGSGGAADTGDAGAGGNTPPTPGAGNGG